MNTSGKINLEYLHVVERAVSVWLDQSLQSHTNIHQISRAHASSLYRFHYCKHAQTVPRIIIINNRHVFSTTLWHYERFTHDGVVALQFKVHYTNMTYCDSYHAFKLLTLTSSETKNFLSYPCIDAHYDHVQLNR